MSKTIFCRIGEKSASFTVGKQDTVNDVVESILKLKSEEEGTIPRIFDKDGYLIPIGPSIEPNDENSVYKLEFLAKKANTVSQAKKDLDLIGNKLQHLKKFAYTANESFKIKLTPAVTKVNDRLGQPRNTKKFQNICEKTYPDDVYESLKRTDFEVWKFQDASLLHFLAVMFVEFGLVSHFSIDTLKLGRFLKAVSVNYNNNPYHNFKHCFCVTQMMYVMLNGGIHEKLSKVEIMALLIASLGHDLDHPGLNNAYHMNALTELAITYNDASPLENHHAAVLFAILKREDCNFLDVIPIVEYREIRKIIIYCILSTDMGKHAEFLGQLREEVKNFNIETPEHKKMLHQLLIKCADISNEARPTHISEPWADLLLEEFFAQSDKEKSEGLPVAPFMDREKVNKASAQAGFIGFVLLPLIEDASQMIPQLADIKTAIIKAKEYYVNMMMLVNAKLIAE